MSDKTICTIHPDGCKYGAPHAEIPVDVVVEWGDNASINWDNADDATKEKFALTRLYWFFKLATYKGNQVPIADELDRAVFNEAKQAAEWFSPILHARAEAAGLG